MADKTRETKKSSSAKVAAPASNESVLAAIAAQGTTLAELVEDLRKSMEGRLDAIDASFATLQNDHHDAEKRMDEMDTAISEVDTRMTAIETTATDLTEWLVELKEENLKLKSRLESIESYSRRLNIRLVGISEGEEQQNPTEFVSKLIPELLGPGSFDKPVKIDRAHRSLRARPPPTANPRVIIAKLHHDRDVRTIFELSRDKGQLRYKGKKVFIFPDYTAEVASKRQAFNKVKKRLTDGGAKCSLRFPAKLQVVHNNKTEVYEKPEDAETYADTAGFPALPPLDNKR